MSVAAQRDKRKVPTITNVFKGRVATEVAKPKSWSMSSRWLGARFHGSFKREVAQRMIFFGEQHLQRSIDEFLEYYHCERNHQGLAGQIIDSEKSIGSTHGKLRRRQRIGGLLNYYYSDAA
jgi:hypothetical protein